MTDRQTLLQYRLARAEETLADTENMLLGDVSPRSVLNRAYYAMFYAAQALLLHFEVRLNTSKHAGVISLFDKELVHKGRIGTHYSKILHRMFDKRQEVDYKDMVMVSRDDAVEGIDLAKDFYGEVRRLILQAPGTGENLNPKKRKEG